MNEVGKEEGVKGLALKLVDSILARGFGRAASIVACSQCLVCWCMTLFFLFVQRQLIVGC